MRASLVLGRRLSRLQIFSGGPCLACAGRPYVTLREGQEHPTCAVCKRPLPAVRIVKIDDFYGNAARLAALAEEDT
jgi:hypothetical protein